MTALALLLAEAVASPEAGAPPAWVTTMLGVATVVLGVLKALDASRVASRVAQLQGALRRTKEALRVVASVLDRLDGDEDPQEIKAAIRAESTAAGTEPVIKATLAEIRGVAPKPPGSPGLNGVAPALLLALAFGASGCVAGEVHETAVRAQRAARVYRAATVAAPSYDAEGKAAVKKLGDDLEAALAAIEEASR